MVDVDRMQEIYKTQAQIGDEKDEKNLLAVFIHLILFFASTSSFYELLDYCIFY